MATCNFQGCRNGVLAKGWCSAHYKQAAAGRVLKPVRYLRQPIADRFWPKVEKSADLDGCWVWRAATDGYGYGQMTIDYKRRKAHRVAYELVVGPIPVGLSLDHLCRNRACVNPAHLEPVTHAENVSRGTASETLKRRHAARTHCKHGHEFTPENTYVNPLGSRVCRACQRQWQRDRQDRKSQPRT